MSDSPAAGAARTRVAFAAGLLLSGLAVFHPLLQGKVLGGSVIDRPPFGEYAAPSLNMKFNDIEAAIHPFLAQVARETRAGRVALWNPYAGLGVPLLANQQSAALHPFTIAAVLLSWRAAIMLLALLRFAMAFGGAWLLARDRGTSPEGSAVAAAAFVLAGYSVDFLAFPLGGVFAHLPLLCFLARRAAREGGVRHHGALVATLVSSVLAGHFEHLPLVWGAALAAGAWVAPRRLVALLACSALAALLSGAMLLPGVEYLALSGILEMRGGGSRPPSVPDAVPGPVASKNRRMVIKEARAGSGKAPPQLLLSRNLPPVPFLVLAAGGAAALGGPAMAAGTLLLAGVSEGAPVLSSIWPFIPVLSMSARDRLSYVVVLLVGLLAGRGLDGAVGASASRRRIAAAGLAGAGAVAALVHPEAGARPTQAVSAILTVAALALPAQRWGRVGSRVLLASALVAAAPWSISGRQRWERPSRIYPELPELRQIAASVGHERISGWHGVLPPSLGTTVGLRDARNFDGLWTGRLLENWKWGADAPSSASRSVGVRHILVDRTPPWRRIDPPGGELVPGEPLAPPARLERTLELGDGYVTELALHAAPIGAEESPLLRVSLALPDGQPLWSTQRPASSSGGWLALRVSPPVRGSRAAVMTVEPRGGPIALSSARATEPGAAPVSPAVRLVRQRHPLPFAEGGGKSWAVATDAEALGRARLDRNRKTPVTWLRDDATALALEVDAPTTDRLLVADRCYPGWVATRDGVEVPLDCREGTEIRSVDVPAGRHVVELRYEPASYRIGLFVSCGGLGLAVALALYRPRTAA